MRSGDFQKGTAHVVFGVPSGMGSVFDLSSPVEFTIDGAQICDRAGSRVAAAGDVNGDGFDDVLVTSINADGVGSYAGVVYVVFGRFGAWYDSVNVANLTGDTGFKIMGSPLDLAGQSLSSAGDLNGDGFDDILIGTSNNAAYVVFGKASGFSPSIDLGSLSAADGFKMTGGGSVVVVAARRRQRRRLRRHPHRFAGHSKCRRGRRRLRTAGDLGLLSTSPHLRPPAGPRSTATWRATRSAGPWRARATSMATASPISSSPAPAASMWFRQSGLRAAGQCRHHVGPPTASRSWAVPSTMSPRRVTSTATASPTFSSATHGAGGADVGVAYVIFGKASGLVSVVQPRHPGRRRRVQDLGRGRGQPGGVGTRATSMATALADILVGARNDQAGGIGAGAAYVIYGRPNRTDFAGDTGNNNITGTPLGDFFDLSQGGDDIAMGLGSTTASSSAPRSPGRTRSTAAAGSTTRSGCRAIIPGPMR